MMRARFLAVATLSVSAALAAAARPIRTDASFNPLPGQASFDCTRAATGTERLICSDGRAGVADIRLAWVYRALLHRSDPTGRAALQEAQRTWLKRRDACATAQCLDTLYSDRLDALERAFDARNRVLRAHLAHVGDCETTRIDFIGPRLEETEGQEPDGTSVGMENGVGLVSYAREAPALRSRIGDPVRVCLAAIPHGCPKGDDRGREYAVTNLRTGGRWRMPDAEHECGGA